MTDLLASLNNDQRTLIACIGDPFLRYERWPLFEYVEAELDKDGLDVRQVLASLPEIGSSGQRLSYGLIWHDDSIPNDTTQMKLTLAGYWHLNDPTAFNVCNRFIQVLNYLIERRLLATYSPFEHTTITITSEDIAKRFPAISPSTIKVLGIFLPHEAATWGRVKKVGDDGQWSIELHHNLLQYRGVNSFEEYLKRVAERLAPPAIEPTPAVPSPLGLCATLDYFNAVWQLQFDQKKPIIRLFGAERTGRLVYAVNTMDEFSTQISSITEILKNMSVSGQGKTPLMRLQDLLQTQLPAESHARIADAVAVLRDVTEVRNALFQHSGSEHRAVQALTNLGLSFPVTDWRAAWETVELHVIAAFSALREEIQLAQVVED